jgi:hypothetical protein
MAMPMLQLPWGEMVAYTGEWPPPETLYMVIGKKSGGRSFSNDAIMEKEGLTLERIMELCHVTVLKRTTYSTLPEEVDAHEHVARCAAYEEVEP